MQRSPQRTFIYVYHGGAVANTGIVWGAPAGATYGAVSYASPDAQRGVDRTDPVRCLCFAMPLRGFAYTSHRPRVIFVF